MVVVSDRVLVLVLPRVNLLDLGGPAQVFDTAATLGGHYRLEFVAETPSVRSAQGLALAELAPLPEVASGELVLIPGPRLSSPSPLVSPAVVEWVREAYRRGARLASVCTGAAVLGEAGLLDGRECTTHWQLIEHMRKRYPAARVRDAVLYVHDGQISTSAGIASGIDLALSFVERELGPALTAAVARQLVVYLRRDGTETQLSPFLQYRSHLHPAVHRVQDHLAQHLDRQHTLTDLALVAHVSPRSLTRVFSAAIGLTPLQYQQKLRLRMAQDLLTETDMPVEAIAARCGFRDGRHFRRLYSASFGRPPSSARHRQRGRLS